MYLCAEHLSTFRNSQGILSSTMTSSNLILMADSYKAGHYKLYPPDTTKILSYFESRGGKFDKAVFFGLQYVVKKWLCQRITKEMVDEAEAFFALHLPTNGDNVFNRKGWDYIVNDLQGKIPVVIRAVPEGTSVPVKNVLFTVENTDPSVAWITNYLETLLVTTWYPMTVCTSTNYQMKLFKKYSEMTCDNLDNLTMKLNDFGMRGSTSMESGGIGGCAHLTHFKGTDNVTGCMIAKQFYGCNGMPGTSVVATEHSIMTSWGPAQESAAVLHILEECPVGIVSVVCDSYDIWSFIDNIIAKELKEKIIKRKGVFVVRPDSGDPKETLIKVLEKLGQIFPPVVNSKGFKVLPDYIRVIQGDGIELDTLESILKGIADSKFSLDNVNFGSGGGLLQKVNRDTMKCAYKCCQAQIGGQLVDVFKNPITDPGKQSKRGNLTLVQKLDGSYETKLREEIGKDDVEILVEIFRDGEMVKEWSLQEVRDKIMSEL